MHDINSCFTFLLTYILLNYNYVHIMLRQKDTSIRAPVFVLAAKQQKTQADSWRLVTLEHTDLSHDLSDRNVDNHHLTNIHYYYYYEYYYEYYYN